MRMVEFLSSGMHPTSNMPGFHRQIDQRDLDIETFAAVHSSSEADEIVLSHTPHEREICNVKSSIRNKSHSTTLRMTL